MWRNIFEIVLLVLIWCGFGNDFSLFNMGAATLIATAIVLVMNRARGVELGVNVIFLIKLVAIIIFELVKSSIEVSLEVCGFTRKCRADMIEVSLGCSNDFQRTVLANLISLTPGTLSVDLCHHDKRLRVHIMFAQQEESFVKFIKQTLEPTIMRAFYVRKS